METNSLKHVRKETKQRMIKILTTNVNGLEIKVDKLIDTIRRENIDITLIQETHNYDSVKIIQKFEEEGLLLLENKAKKNTMGMRNYKGTCIAIKPSLTKNLIKRNIIEGRLQMVVLPSLGNTKIYNVYMPSGTSVSKRKKRMDVIKQLNEDLIISMEKRIILGGDINMIEGRNDIRHMKKEYLYQLNREDVETFKICRKDHELIDIYREQNPNGRVFTRIRPDTASRIDKIYVKTNHQEKLGVIKHIATPYSDHCLSPLLEIVKNEYDLAQKSPWKLNANLLGKEMKIKVGVFLKEWRKRKTHYADALTWWDVAKAKIKKIFMNYGKERAQKKKLEWKTLTERLIELNETVGRNTTTNQILDTKQKLQRLQDEKLQGERLRYKTLYIEKDETRSIFDTKRRQSRKKNDGIQKLKLDNGITISDLGKINEEIYNEYNQIWGENEVIKEEEQLTYINKLFKEKQRTEAKNPIIQKENLNKVIKNLGKNASPGNDGITNEFYTFFREEITEDLYEVFANIYMCESLTNTQKEAMVKLISKGGDDKLLTNYRPISLLNCDYKILAKCVNEKLLDEITSEISKEQKGAIKGRKILDIHLNIKYILQESRMRKKSLIISTFDIKKAFDKIDWNFLHTILNKVASPELYRWIKIMYKGISSIIWNNGKKVNEIKAKRGIRQGCPLSMTLYVVAAEALTRAINNNQQVKQFGKYHKMEQFVDDVTLITPGIDSLVQATKELYEYCRLSGQEIHPKKTQIIANIFETPSKRKNIMKQIEVIGELGPQIKILGIFYNNDESMKEEIWSNIIHGMQKRADAHKRRNLTKIGRCRLFNGLILPLTNNLAAVFEPSKKEVEKIKKIMFEMFWYPKKIEPIARSKLTAELEEGGLGLINLENRFKALKTKKILEILIGNEQPWVDWARYQLGSKVNQIAPGSYKNRLNALKTNEEWSQLLTCMKELLKKNDLDEMRVWRTRQMYRAFNKQAIVEANWENVLLRKPMCFFTNEERVTSYMVKNRAFKWGDFKRKYEGFRKRKEILNCNLCGSKSDNVEHLLMSCNATNDVKNKLIVKIENMTRNTFGWTREQIMENEIKDEKVKKILAIYKVELLKIKQQLEENNQWLNNDSPLTKRLWGTVKNRFKTFCMELSSKNPDMGSTCVNYH